jgi:hypothetical protein
MVLTTQERAFSQPALSEVWSRTIWHLVKSTHLEYRWHFSALVWESLTHCSFLHQASQPETRTLLALCLEGERRPGRAVTCSPREVTYLIPHGIGLASASSLTSQQVLSSPDDRRSSGAHSSFLKKTPLQNLARH